MACGAQPLNERTEGLQNRRGASHGDRATAEPESDTRRSGEIGGWGRTGPGPAASMIGAERYRLLSSGSR